MPVPPTNNARGQQFHTLAQRVQQTPAFGVTVSPDRLLREF
uniref:Uncharacterized protein n=1 Tax=Rhodopseudomonas palustris (strain DX-1) TaxID=652103 RepID=E6VEI7_RHOPX